VFSHCKSRTSADLRPDALICWVLGIHNQKRRKERMSHIVTIQTKLHDRAAIYAACNRLKLPEPTIGTAKVYLTEVTGLLLEFPGWEYLAVINTETGQVQYDNFNGEWGDQAHFDAFLQAYAVEKTKLEARRSGHLVSEQTQTDGSIKLTIQVA
jgi:hypothetical protein